jgi:hypothetical protein
LERKYQQRIVHVTANTSGRDLGSIANEIEDKISKMKIPEGFSVLLKGARLEQKEAFQMLFFALALPYLLDLYGACFSVRLVAPSFSDYVFSPSGLYRRHLGPVPYREYAERHFFHRDHHDGWNCGE